MTVKYTDQKPKGICEGHWRIQRPSHLRSRACMLSVSFLISHDNADEVSFIRREQPVKEHCEGCLAASWGVRGAVVLDSAWNLLEAAFSCPCCLLPPFSLCPVCRACFTMAYALPIASVVGDQGEWPQVKSMVAHALFPELQTETLSPETYRETRIVPGFSVLHTEWALVSYQT